MDGDSATSPDSTTGSDAGVTAVHLLTMLKENKLEVLIMALIAQQMGWLATATTQLSGVCF